MFGGGGLNPRKMKQMMEQMGIDLHELDAEQVIIRTSDGEELVFDAPDVTRMDARGQQTYQVIGTPETRDVSTGQTETADEATSATDAEDDGDGDDGDIPDEDVRLVAQRAGVSESEARETLAAVNGDLAAAIDRLE